jgi:hypothetical protein
VLIKLFIIKTYGGIEVQLHKFVTLAVDEWSASCFGSFTTRVRTPIIHQTEDQMEPRGGLHTVMKVKVPAPAGN